ncbi:Uncharacterized protein PBTT_00848 [Plasmodiophora brassicae]|uniref:Uncharacterized protein n=1 Tax=Plasmodiophora brassicae TaxID=37360 RepID=A0A0G4II20_PLABS|nr:hypothetical protein PBRA_000508 [Plasmodiophora brassicae]
MGNWGSRRAAPAAASAVSRGTAAPAGTAGPVRSGGLVGGDDTMPRSALRGRDFVKAGATSVAQEKDESYVAMLNQVASVDVKAPPTITTKSSSRPLPRNKVSGGEFIPPVMSGRLTGTEWADLIVMHRKDPNKNAPEALAAMFNVEPVVLESVLSTVTVPAVFSDTRTREMIGKWDAPEGQDVRFLTDVWKEMANPEPQ